MGADIAGTSGYKKFQNKHLTLNFLALKCRALSSLQSIINPLCLQDLNVTEKAQPVHAGLVVRFAVIHFTRSVRSHQRQ